MPYIKALFYTIIGWLGMEITQRGDRTNIAFNSFGSEVIFIICFGVFFFGIYQLYLVVKRKLQKWFVKFQKNNYHRIKQRQADASKPSRTS
jgi:hypothetical protein